VNFFLAFSPSGSTRGMHLLGEGHPKIVGGVTVECSRLTALVYRQIVDRVIEVSGPKVAELAKLYENVFRTSISPSPTNSPSCAAAWAWRRAK